MLTIPIRDEKGNIIGQKELRAEEFAYQFGGEAGVSISANGVVSQKGFTTEADSWFLAKWLSSVENDGAGGDYKVRIQDSDFASYWTNLFGGVNRDNLFGTAEYPAELLDTLLFPPKTFVSGDFTDLSGADNVVEAVVHGYHIYPRDAEEEALLIRETLKPHFFQYGIEISLDAGATAQPLNLTINAGQVFRAKKWLATKDASASVLTTFSATGSRRSSNAHLNLDNRAGRALRPVFIKPTLILPFSSTVTFDFNNNDAANANDIQLVMEGTLQKKVA